jgi:hypothetical protein
VLRCLVGLAYEGAIGATATVAFAPSTEEREVSDRANQVIASAVRDELMVHPEPAGDGYAPAPARTPAIG